MKRPLATGFAVLGLGATVLSSGNALAASNDAGSALAAPNGAGSHHDGDIEKHVAAFSTTALGMPGLAFVNQLVGARLELEYAPRFTLGFGAAYANLKGKDGRAHNVLPEVSVEYRLPLLGGALGVPLRLASGYLPKNGPTLRFTSGLDVKLGDTFSLELALLEPMVWVTRDRPELSLDLGVAASARF